MSDGPVAPDAGERPDLINGYLARAAPQIREPDLVRITQSGRMRPGPDGRWLPFRAVEELEVAHVGLTWRAMFPLGPLAWLTVTDMYERGYGHLEARAWGRVPLMRADGRSVARAQAMRYLGELFWVPQALGANRDLGWRQIDERVVEVSAPVAGDQVAVRLAFDDHGDLGEVFAVRPRRVGRTDVDTPWRARVSDYATLGGVRIPRQAQVSWELPEGTFTYWSGTVTGLATY